MSNHLIVLNEETVHMEAGIDGHQFARQTHTPVVGVIFDFLVIIATGLQHLDGAPNDEGGKEEADIGAGEE